MTRIYPRKFDWEDARRRYEHGHTFTEIAQDFGVTWAAINRIISPGAYERYANASRAWQLTGTCDICGASATRRAKGLPTRCRDCSAKSLATSVRDTTLWCATCKQWKPDDQFSRSNSVSKLRRGRHRQCAACNTIKKRDWRNRNQEKQRAYDRAYKAKRRKEQT